VGEDLGAPALERVAERDDLGHLVAETADDHQVEARRRLGGVLGEIDVAQVLLGEPGPKASSFGLPRRSPNAIRSTPREFGRCAPVRSTRWIR
jgi:hypothetical protein